jgi:hypothetical protein
MSISKFVDCLIAHAGVEIDSGKRKAIIDLATEFYKSAGKTETEQSEPRSTQANKVKGSEYPNIEKLNELCKSFVGKKIHISASFNGHSLPIINPNLVGDILENILYPLYKSTCPDFQEGPKQESPDFFGMDDFRFEQKAFIGSPGFDISNFTSFVTQISKPGCLEKKIFRTKYLVYEYGMESDTFVIKNFWMLNIWNLPIYDNTYPISMQVKKKMWYNIRPGTHKSWNNEKKTAEMFLNYLLKCIKVCPHLEKKESLTLSIITQMEEARSQGLL